MSRLELNGEVSVEEATRLRRELAGLEGELREARAEADQAKQLAKDSVQAIRSLRKQLEPLYSALKMVFGEISRVDANSEPAGDLASSGVSQSMWENRIAKATPSQARILRVMLDGGGPMSSGQIRKAAATGSNTPTYLVQLIARNWVEKVAHGSYALKG